MKFALVPVALLALAATAFAEEFSPAVTAQMSAVQAEKAARTPVERKLGSQLHYLTREMAGQRAVEGAPKLRSRVELEKDGRVLVDIAVAPSEDLRKAITAAGGTVIYESPRWSSVRASVPPAALATLAARVDVKRIRQGDKPIPHTGSVTSEGDRAHKADTSRVDFGVDGTGINVGVISDSADFSDNAIALGDLPANFTVLPGRFGSGSGEGTAMSEIVHDVAPGAGNFFAEAGPGKAGFADSILLLHAAGCQIIVDDISYPTEWQFQDDEIGQAINTVVAAGAVYLSSSGNEGSLKRGNSTTWEGDFVDGGTDALLPGGRVHSFGAQNYNRMLADESRVVLQWSDEYPKSGNDYDLHILNAAGTAIVSSSTDTQAGAEEPLELVSGVQPGERIVIWKDNAAAPRYLRISCTGGPIEISTAGQTIGHAATANCICVASSSAPDVFPGSFTISSPSEDSSSDGPHRMFYQPDGTPFTPGNFLAATGGGLVIQSPAITAADGGVTTFPLDGGLNPFYGNSAAAPHAAAIAALVWSRKPTLTGLEIRAILESSCLDIEDPGFDINSGNGILMADLALTQTLTAQEIWRHANFGTYLPNGNAAPDADGDKDGLKNVIEYGTGTDPKASSGSPLTAVSQAGATHTFRYTRSTTATDAVVTFEHSGGLAAMSWMPIAPDSDTFVSTTAGIDLRLVVFTGAPDRDFFRMRVTVP